MFVTAEQVVKKIGVNVLVQFAAAKFAGVGSVPTADDLTAAFQGTASTELQRQIADWYQECVQSVTALISGYVSRYQLSPTEISQSVLPGIAIDLLHYELSANPSESVEKRRDTALRRLDKVDKGVIQVKEDKPTARTGMRTRAVGSQFNWRGY